MTQRNNNKYYTQSGESFTTSKNGEDNVPPPKIAPPVFLSVPPPPPVAPQNGPPVPPSRTRPPPGYMTGGPPRRNAPVRSHSMSIADVNRYVCNRIALQKCFSRENNCIYKYFVFTNFFIKVLWVTSTPSFSTSTASRWRSACRSIVQRS